MAHLPIGRRYSDDSRPPQQPLPKERTRHCIRVQAARGVLAGSTRPSRALREEAAIIGPVSADASVLTLNWIQRVRARVTESVSGERIRFSKRTRQARNATNSGRSTSCSSPFRSTHPGTRNTGCVSQRQTERLTAVDVLYDGFVEPAYRIESACCALQMQ